MFYFFFSQFFFIFLFFLFSFIFFYFFLFDFCLFILKPYLTFFSNLVTNYFLLETNVHLSYYYKQNYIKICFNIIFQHDKINVYFIPDFFMIENNPFFSVSVYLIIFLTLLVIYFFFFYYTF